MAHIKSERRSVKEAKVERQAAQKVAKIAAEKEAAEEAEYIKVERQVKERCIEGQNGDSGRKRGTVD